MALPDTTTVTSVLRVINVDKNAAYPKAIAELKAAGVLPEYVELRQVKYLTDQSDMSNAIALSEQRDAGWVYVTDDGGSNPYDTLPSYWSSELSQVGSS